MHLLTDAADIVPMTRSRHTSSPPAVDVGDYVAVPSKGYYRIGQIVLICADDDYIVQMDDKETRFTYKDIMYYHDMMQRFVIFPQ